MSRLAGLLIVVLGASGCSSGQVSPEVLAERSIKGTPAEQEKAVLELGRRGPDMVPHLRRVLKESPTPMVRAAAMQSLGEFQDYWSGPSLFAALDDPDPNVRGRAAGAITAIIGADYHYRAEDPPQRRALAAAGMKKSYDQMAKNPDLKRW